MTKWRPGTLGTEREFRDQSWGAVAGCEPNASSISSHLPVVRATCPPGWEMAVARVGKGRSPFFLNDDTFSFLFVFSRDLSNNKISSLSNSSFTNMSQLTTL